jgi:hypothetical protein
MEMIRNEKTNTERPSRGLELKVNEMDYDQWKNQTDEKIALLIAKYGPDYMAEKLKLVIDYLEDTLSTVELAQAIEKGIKQ